MYVLCICALFHLWVNVFQAFFLALNDPSPRPPAAATVVPNLVLIDLDSFCLLVAAYIYSIEVEWENYRQRRERENEQKREKKELDLAGVESKKQRGQQQRDTFYKSLERMGPASKQGPQGDRGPEGVQDIQDFRGKRGAQGLRCQESANASLQNKPLLHQPLLSRAAQLCLLPKPSSSSLSLSLPTKGQPPAEYESLLSETFQLSLSTPHLCHAQQSPNTPCTPAVSSPFSIYSHGFHTSISPSMLSPPLHSNASPAPLLGMLSNATSPLKTAPSSRLRLSASPTKDGGRRETKRWCATEEKALREWVEKLKYDSNNDQRKDWEKIIHSELEGEGRFGCAGERTARDLRKKWMNLCSRKKDKAKENEKIHN
jgi:hypothetical protein